MNKTAQTLSVSADISVTSAALFLSFCRALDEYCEKIGIAGHRFGAARILHDGACNTFMRMNKVTPATIRHMANMERKIPEMFAGLIEIQNTHGYLHSVDLMAEMSLAQIAAHINQNSHKR